MASAVGWAVTELLSTLPLNRDILRCEHVLTETQNGRQPMQTRTVRSPPSSLPPFPDSNPQHRSPRGRPEGDIHIMGAFDPDRPPHHRPIHQLLSADAEDTGRPRDGALHLCRDVCRPDPSRHRRRIHPGDGQLRLPDVFQPSATTYHPVVWVRATSSMPLRDASNAMTDNGRATFSAI